MKKIITLCLVLAASISLFAQQVNLTQFATLTHNDTVTGQWYGPTAFVSAHDAAVHGDIITLSPGTFNGTPITKALIIRGHGMLPDSVANTSSTIISGQFGLMVPDVENHHLSIEGISFSGTFLAYYRVYNPHFNRCKFNQIRATISNGMMYNPFFSNCIIGEYDGSSEITNAMFVNCIILSSWTENHYRIYSNLIDPWFSNGWGENRNGSTYTCGVSQDVYYNCIINLSSSYTGHKRMIVNSIVYGSDTIQSTSTNVTNTIGITDSLSYFATPSAGNNTNIQGFESVFKTFRGTYTDGEKFELTPQAASTYLGTDNTQVGIYGGSTPFNPKATDPRIMKVSPAYSSNGNGQLPVTIQLRAQ